MIDRRTFLAGTGAVLLAAPLAAEGQQAGKTYRIGWLGNTPSGDPANTAAFQQSLRDLGWVEGQNIVFERRYSEGRPERLPSLAAELVRLKPDLIVTMGGTPSAAAAKQATTTIPIVFCYVGDPVASGFVASLSRPGGNLTGLGATGAGIHAKLLELMKEALPRISTVAVFVNSTFSLHTNVTQPEVEAAARNLRLTLRNVEVRSPQDLDGAFESSAREKLDAVIVLGQPLMFTHRQRAAKLAIERQVPTAFYWREAVEAGALMSYGDRIIDAMRRCPYYVDRILRGAKPADLPVEQPTTFYLTINLKTAKALGLTIPQSLLARADEVIQ